MSITIGPSGDSFVFSHITIELIAAACLLNRIFDLLSLEFLKRTFLAMCVVCLFLNISYKFFNLLKSSVEPFISVSDTSQLTSTIFLIALIIFLTSSVLFSVVFIVPGISVDF